jgi:hypothetical protein
MTNTVTRLLMVAAITGTATLGSAGAGAQNVNPFEVLGRIISSTQQQQQQQAPVPQQQVAPAPAPQPAAPPPPPMPAEQVAFINLPPLSMAQVQTQLTQLGYYRGVADGAYGGQTAASVRAWQKSQGLAQTGYLSQFEQTRLKDQASTAGAPSGTGNTGVAGAGAAGSPPKPEAAAAPAPIVSVDQALLVSLRNRYAAVVNKDTADALMLGDSRDLIFFFNESETAPYGVRTLAGDIKFNGNRASVCMLNESAPADDFLDNVKATIVTKGRTLDNFNFQMLRCTFVAAPPGTQSKSAPFDLFAVERRLLTSTDQKLTSSIVSYLKDKIWTVYDTADAASFFLRKEKMNAEAQQNASSLRDGKLEGFGMLVLRNGSKTFCGSNTEEKDLLLFEAQRLNRSIAELTDRHSGPTELSQAGLEDLFISIKRERCRYVLGDNQLLGKLVSALDRDGIKFTMAPLWIPNADYQGDLKTIQEKLAVAASQIDEQRRAEKDAQAKLRQETEEQKQQREQQEKLDAARLSADETARRAELERNRKLVTTRGQALVDGFNKEVRRHLGSVTEEIAELRKRPLSKGPVSGEEKVQEGLRAKERLGDDYKAFNNWALERIKEQWEFGDTVAALEDYGLAKFRSRLIEAISIKVELPMLNRLIGERKTECFQFTWINDDEFTMRRSLAIAPCAAYPAQFKAWSEANQFKSQWKL